MERGEGKKTEKNGRWKNITAKKAASESLAKASSSSCNPNELLSGAYVLCLIRSDQCTHLCVQRAGTERERQRLREREKKKTAKPKHMLEFYRKHEIRSLLPLLSLCELTTEKSNLSAASSVSSNICYLFNLLSVIGNGSI